MKKTIFILTLCIALAMIFTASENIAKASSDNVLKTNTTDSVVREVIGQGRNRDEAVKNALYRAVEQARGVKVDSANYQFGYRGTTAGFNSTQPGQRSIDIDSMNFSTQGTVYTTQIEGLIKGFEVIEEKQVNDQTYEVKLKVNVYDYSARGLTPRVKVALLPVKTMQTSYRFLDQTISGQTLSILFSQRLMMGLTQTNKFSVLDRESIGAFIDEKAMLLAFDAPLGEQAKIAETIGADYLLVGTITQAFVERIDKRLEAANFTSTEYKARFDFSYRLIDSSTKQVALALDEQKYLENDEVRKLADETNTAEWNASQIRDAFLAIAANDIIEKIIDCAYPVKIASIQDDGTVILNQGGDRMKTGTIFDVFSKGKEITDSDTGQSLGSVENHVAAIEVQRVAGNISYAKLIEGTQDKISEGLVCRVRSTGKPEAPGSRKSNITRTESGGVVMPFDR
jgi:curli biogenesis system outer membrane secretion channel CsgG